jgi:uracil-DNA glycosylase family 4
MRSVEVLIDDEWIEVDINGTAKKTVAALLDHKRRVRVDGRDITSLDDLTVNINVEHMTVKLKTPKPKPKKKTRNTDYDEAGNWRTVAAEEEDDDDYKDVVSARSKKPVQETVYIPLEARIPTDEDRAKRKHPAALCEHCSLFPHRFVPSSGPTDAKYIFVGEAPGEEEVGAGRPFVGWSGKVLRAALEKVGIDENEAFLTNACLCRPPDNDIKSHMDALDCCLPRLIAEINEVEGAGNVDRLIATGKSGAESIAKAQGHVGKITITKERGRWSWPTAHGRIDLPAMLTVHPAFVLRTPSVYPLFETDLRRAKAGPQRHPLQTAPTVRVAWTEIQLLALLDEIEDGKWVCFDIETEQTTYFDRPDKAADKVLMIALAHRVDEAIIIPPFLYEQSIVGRRIIQSFFDRVKLTAHNGKFDWLFLMGLGLQPHVDDDTMLMHYALCEVKGTHGLKQLATDLYGVEDYEAALIKRYLTSVNDNYGKIPFEPFAQYAGHDVCITLQLREDLEKRLKDEGLYEWPYRNVLMRANSALAWVEHWGILLDVPYVEHMRAMLEAEQQQYLAELREMSGRPELNPGSPVQLAKVIYDDLGFKPYEGHFVPYRSTNKRAFELVGQGLKDHPFVLKLNQYRRVSKILSSYVNNMLGVVAADGKIHTSYLIHGTITGRLSAQKPALQTIPRGSDKYGSMIRGAFIAPPGKKLVFGDYSQAELRIWAADCDEHFMLDVFENDRDFHGEAAAKLFGPDYTKEQRNYCKFFNFAYAYGGNDKSFAGHFQLPLEQASAFVREYERSMPAVKGWRQRVFREAKHRGYCQTRTGRRLRFPLITPESLDEVRKAAMNMPIQGMASDLTLMSLCEMVERGYKVVITVHDSIGVECDEADAEHVMKVLEEVMVKTGEQWVPEVKWRADCEVLDRWTLRPDEDDVTLIDGEVVIEDEVATVEEVVG